MSGALISRVADHCFWFGRYLERAEATARALTVTHAMALGAERAVSQIWLPVIIVAGEEERFGKLESMEKAEDGDLVQRYMTWEERNPVSIYSSIEALRENARAIRDQISLETWKLINELRLWFSSPAAMEQFDNERFSFYGQVSNAMAQVHGLLAGTMLHDRPLDFIMLGGYLERAGQTARILDVHHHANTRLRSEVIDVAVWLSFLRALGAYEPFMKRERGRVQDEAVVRFLVLEPGFPRSVLHCVSAAFSLFQRMRPAGAPALRSATRLGKLERWLVGHDQVSVREAGVHEVLTHVVDEIGHICVEIGEELLGAAPPQPVATGGQSQSQSVGEKTAN